MRLKVNHSKNKTFYYIFDSYRKDGKIVTTIAEKVGEHSELLAKGISDPLSYAKERLEALNSDRKENKVSMNYTYDFSEQLTNSNLYSNVTYKNIGYRYLSSLYDQLNLKALLDNIAGQHHYNANEITKYLSIDRVLTPQSKKASFENRVSYFDAPDYALHDSYRLLSLLSSNEEAIQSALFEGTKKLIDLNTDVLYYDCTNFYFESEEADDNEYDDNGDIVQWGLRRYGLSKQHQPSPLVQMGLFTDFNGIPISYCICHGSNNEQNTVIPLETRMIKNYKASKFIYCSDGGLGSFENRFFNTLQGRDYVVTQSLKKTEEKELNVIFKDDIWKFVNNDEHISLEYFKSLADKVINNEELTDKEKEYVAMDMIYKPHPFTRTVDAKFLGGLKKITGTFKMDETVYTTFSIKYYIYQKSILDRQIETAKEWLNKDVDKIKKGPNDIRRFIKTSTINENGEVKSIDNKVNTIDEDVIEKERRFQGFYAIATSLDTTIKNLIDISSARWKIEQSFRIMKTDFHSRPAYVSDAEHIKGHFCICYIALLMYRILERKLLLLDEKNNQFSTNQILNTLRNMNIVPINDGTIYQSLYTGSNVLEQLEKLFNQSLNHKYYKSKKLLKYKH